MNFDLSEDEELLKAAVERFVADRYDTDRRRAFSAEPFGFSEENWRILGDLGLIAGCFDEADGGLGLDATGIAVLCEALGRGITVEPLIENVLLAGRLFAATAPVSLQDKWLPLLVAGEKRLALAHAEAGARDNRAFVETRCVAQGNGWVLDGAKPYVVAGGGADGYVVTARGAEGVSLLFVPADAPGMTVSEWRTADGGGAAALRFDATPVQQDHLLAGGLDAVAAAQTFATLGRCAEAVGLMDTLLAQTLDYLRTREQFGTALGSFQAIQHRMVAQYAALEQARALLNLAIVSPGAPDFARAVDGARAFIAPASLTLGHEMIQFHGGMGVTEELAIGAAHKRLLMFSRWPESPQATLNRFAAA